jgi:hypothetical protein
LFAFHLDKQERPAKTIIGLLKIFRGKPSRVESFLKVIGYEGEPYGYASASPRRVTQLLADWSDGDDATLAMDSKQKVMRFTTDIFYLTN